MNRSVVRPMGGYAGGILGGTRPLRLGGLVLPLLLVLWRAASAHQGAPQEGSPEQRLPHELLPQGGRAPAAAPQIPVVGAGLRATAEPNTELLTRLHWIDARLTRTAGAARGWTLGWAGSIGAAGVVSLGAVPWADPEEHVDWYVSAATSAIGVLQLALSPMAVLRDAERLHLAVARVDDGSLRGLLREAEGTLRRNAEDQRSRTRWWAHAGNVAFNVTVALILGLGFDHWASGLIQGGSGIAVGEAILFTQPTSSLRDLEEYRRTFTR